MLVEELLKVLDNDIHIVCVSLLCNREVVGGWVGKVEETERRMGEYIFITRRRRPRR